MEGSASPRNPSVRDRQQILDVVQLAGRVPFEGQQSVVAQHAASVVGDADQPPPAVFDLDANAGRARIERVLQQLFGDGRRPLDDLARRDLVCDVVRKDPDATHVENYRAQRHLCISRR